MGFRGRGVGWGGGGGDVVDRWLGRREKQTNRTPYLGGLTSGAPDLEGKNRKRIRKTGSS